MIFKIHNLSCNITHLKHNKTFSQTQQYIVSNTTVHCLKHNSTLSLKHNSAVHYPKHNSTLSLKQNKICSLKQQYILSQTQQNLVRCGYFKSARGFEAERAHTSNWKSPDLHWLGPLGGEVWACLGSSARPRRHAQGQAASYRTVPPPRKIRLISWGSMSLVSDIKLIRTDTTLDLSQKAEKGMNQLTTPGGSYTLRMVLLWQSIWD